MALLLSDEVPRPLLLQSRQFPIPNVETYDRTFGSYVRALRSNVRTPLYAGYFHARLVRANSSVVRVPPASTL